MAGWPRFELGPPCVLSAVALSPVPALLSVGDDAVRLPGVCCVGRGDVGRGNSRQH